MALFSVPLNWRLMIGRRWGTSDRVLQVEGDTWVCCQLSGLGAVGGVELCSSEYQAPRLGRLGRQDQPLGPSRLGMQMRTLGMSL